MPADGLRIAGDMGCRKAFTAGSAQEWDEVLTAIFRPDETVQRPHLVGGELLQKGAGARGSVYVGSPSIRIPLTGRGTVEEELARWRITAYSKWAAIPEVQVIQTLTELRSQLALGGIRRPALNLPSLLGDKPMGNYDVRLRGPLGRDAEFTLRCIPHLVICEHKTLYLPDPKNGPEPAVLLVETDPRDTIECRGHVQMGGRGDAERESIVCAAHLAEKTPLGWEYEIKVDPEVVELEITVVRPRPGSDAVRVPISLPIRRLRWAFVEEQTGPISREWSGRIIRRPLEALLQAQSPELLVTLPVEETQPLTMTLRLLDVDNVELMVRQANKPPHGRWLWRIDLSAFLDTVRASLSPVLRCELNLQGLPDAEGARRWSVLSLAQSLIVENVHVHSAIQGDRLDLAIRWDEAAPLRHRRLRMWSLWQPWRPVYERIIPDDVTGELAFSAPIDELPPGGYRLEFVVVDPWSSEESPQRPKEDAPGTADVALTVPTERQNWLTMRMEQTEKRFPRLLERAHIRHELGDTRGSREDCQRCFEQLDEGTVPQILTLCDLLSTLGDQYNLRALELKMYAAERMKRFLQEHAQGQLALEHFQAYMAHITRSTLLPEATCALLLSLDDERVRLYAVQQLVRRSNALGPATVIQWVQEAQMSDADAIAILKLNSQFSADYLDEHQTIRQHSAFMRRWRVIWGVERLSSAPTFGSAPTLVGVASIALRICRVCRLSNLSKDKINSDSLSRCVPTRMQNRSSLILLKS